MKFFLSGEVYGDLFDSYFEIRNSLEDSLVPILADKNYGDELVDICIIVIIMPRSILDDGFFKERKLFKRKSNEADMRLQIDYEKFSNSDKYNQKLLFVKIIIDSVRILDERAKKDFDGKKLEKDILEILNIKVEEINCL